MTGRLWRLLSFATLAVAIVALIVMLSVTRSTRGLQQDLASLQSDVARQRSDAAAVQSGAIASLTQRVTDVSSQVSAQSEAVAGITDLATRVSDLETKSESFARAIEFLNTKYPQAKLDEDVVGAVAESGEFTVLQSGVPVGRETYDLLRTDEGYALVSKAVRSDGTWGTSLSSILQLDDALRPTSNRIQGTIGTKARNVSAVWDEEGIHVTTASGRVIVEKVDVGERVAMLDSSFASPLILLHRAMGTSEAEEAEDAATEVQAKAVLTFEGSVSQLILEPAEAVSIISPDVRELGYRHELRIDDKSLVYYYVLDRVVIGVEVPGKEQFAYRGDLFPHGFLVESRELAKLAVSDRFAEQEVPFNNAGQDFVGILTVPTSGGFLNTATTLPEKLPVVFLVPDVGPFDRDDNAVGLQTRIGQQLARQLALQGVATYRYDRRGVGANRGDYAATDLAGLVTDARVALTLLRAMPFVDTSKVYAAGIGQGGVIAGMLAASGAVGGIVTLSTSAQSLGELWISRLERSAAAESLSAADLDLFLERERAFQAFLRKSSGTWDDVPFAAVKSALPWMTELELARRSALLPLPLVRDLLDLNPLETFRKVGKPTLIIQGDKDPDVSSSDGYALMQAVKENGNEESSLSVVTNLNHLLRSHPEAADAPERHISRDIDLRVLELIVNWVDIEEATGGPGALPAAM